MPAPPRTPALAPMPLCASSPRRCCSFLAPFRTLRRRRNPPFTCARHTPCSVGVCQIPPPRIERRSASSTCQSWTAGAHSRPSTYGASRACPGECSNCSLLMAAVWVFGSLCSASFPHTPAEAKCPRVKSVRQTCGCRRREGRAGAPPRCMTQTPPPRPRPSNRQEALAAVAAWAPLLRRRSGGRCRTAPQPWMRMRHRRHLGAAIRGRAKPVRIRRPTCMPPRLRRCPLPRATRPRTASRRWVAVCVRCASATWSRRLDACVMEAAAPLSAGSHASSVDGGQRWAITVPWLSSSGVEFV